MIYTTLEDLKDKYKDGFRCIHTEKTNEKYILQLKNFHTEKIETFETDNLYEINAIERYLECMENEKANGGHDC